MAMPNEDTSVAPLPPEVLNRLVYALLAPAVRLAYTFRIPSKELTRWVQLAYFHEARHQGLKMRETSERLNLSMRKVAQLSSQLKRNFLPDEAAHELPRRIEFMLWAGPLSGARIKQTLPDVDDGAIDEAIDLLCEQGRIRPNPDRAERFEVVTSEHRLVTDMIAARVDGLSNLTSNLANTVFSRFLRSGDTRSFARTLDFRVPRQAIGRLRALYDEVLWEALRRLDTEAQDLKDGDVERISLSILWSPHELLKRVLQSDLAAERANRRGVHDDTD